MLGMIAFAAMLLAGAGEGETRPPLRPQSQGSSQAKQQQQQPSETQAVKEAKPGQSGPAEPGDDEHSKGYGYGTPSGVEAGGSARQSGAPERARSTSPQQEEGASVTQPHARAEAGTLSGRVVSTVRDRLTIEAADGRRELQLTGRTRVRGVRASVSELRPGDEVRVSFEPRKGASIATQIDVRAAAPTGATVQPRLEPSPGSATPPGSTTSPGTTTPGGERRP